jgi:hypothetical protein
VQDGNKNDVQDVYCDGFHKFVSQDYLEERFKMFREKKMIFLLVTITVLFPLFALSACGTITSGAEDVVPNENVPNEEEDVGDIGDVNAPEHEDVPDIVFEGISFSYDDSLATGVKHETVPAVIQFQPGEMVAPEYIQVTFEGYVLSDSMHMPRIMIYPVSELEAVNERAAEKIERLDQLLAERPEFAPDGGFEASNLPFLPMVNAGQYLRTQIAYLDFENGKGLRYLTQFGQAMLPVNNQGLFYTFQGLTDDGAYYVSAVLPVSHSMLPPDDQGLGFTGNDRYDEFIAGFDTYILEVAQQLNEQTSESFSPDLGLLDMMIQSISVE